MATVVKTRLLRPHTSLHAPRMKTPGANRSTQLPTSEKLARLSMKPG